MKLQTAVLGLSLWLAQIIKAEPIPEYTGQYNVGVRRYVVDFVNPNDPTSPNNVSTQYMATIYYPTEDDPSPPTRFIEPELAQLYADAYQFNISHLTATSRWHASFLRESVGPTLIFTPGGWGAPTDGFTILLTELASHGYVIAALDHPYELPFIRFPNGTGVVGTVPLVFTSTQPFIDLMHAVRLRELLHFVSYWPKLVTRLCAPFQKDSLGAIGHSLGGSVSLNAALKSDNIVAALNQDGSIFGAAAANVSADLGKPSLLLAADGHLADRDVSWRNYTTQQTGWWRVINVKGTLHQDWSDLSFWKLWGTTRPMGPINGRRMVEVRSAYVTAFFDEHLRGLESPLLDAPSDAWPEVYISSGSADL